MAEPIYSVGHSNRPLEDLVALLRGARVDTVVDVRRNPRSRWPQFNRAALERELAARGFDYRWAGDKLGGLRDEGYSDWMETEAFAAGVAELLALSEQRTVAFMCSEGLPWKCHRRFIAKHLAETGHEVCHVLPDGSRVGEDPQLALPDL